MLVFLIAAVIIGGYLSGSVNYAIIVTRLVSSRDIRDLGNKNAGAANVGRNIGKGWATIVFFSDFFKCFVPIILVRAFLFSGDTYLDFFVVAAVGIAAIGGHCRPMFHGFRGGGGMASSMGAYLFFVPVEFVVCMLLSALIVLLFVKHAEFRIGRAIPIIFVLMTPFFTLAVNWLIGIQLFAHISIGSHPWYVLVIVFAVSLFILAMNLQFVLTKVRGESG